MKIHLETKIGNTPTDVVIEYALRPITDDEGNIIHTNPFDHIKGEEAFATHIAVIHDIMLYSPHPTEKKTFIGVPLSVDLVKRLAEQIIKIEEIREEKQVEY